MLNIMILAQALQIFCSQGPLQAKKGNTLVKIFTEVCEKLIMSSTMCQNCMPDIMILSQVVHMVAFPHKMPKSEKGHNSANYLQNFA